MPRQIFDNGEPLLDYGAMDELSELGMGDRGYTDVDPPYGSNEIFGDQFERRAREKNRDGGVPGVPSVAVLDPKNGSWSGNNQLGIEQPFAPDANNRQTILKLDEWGFPDIWTISLGLNAFTPTAGGFDVTALIQYGAGGVTQEVEIDWLNGSGITLPMNALNVIAQYNLINEEVPGEVPSDLRLRVSISRRPAHDLRPTRSFWVTTPANVFAIPPFAKALHISSISAAPNPFNFYNQAVVAAFITRTTGPNVLVNSYLFSQFVTSIDVANSKVGAPKFVPIPPYARAVQFLTVGAGAPSNQQCVLQYLIGI